MGIGESSKSVHIPSTVSECLGKVLIEIVSLIFLPGSITVNTRLVLVNAVHLRSPWAETFEREDTVDEDFTDAAGRTKKVPTMVGKLVSEKKQG